MSIHPHAPMNAFAELTGTVIEADTGHIWLWRIGTPMAEALRIPRGELREDTAINCGRATVFVDRAWLTAIEQQENEHAEGQHDEVDPIAAAADAGLVAC